MVPNRREIVRACKKRGWSLQPAVLADFQELLQQQPGQDLARILSLLESEMNNTTTTGKTVTSLVWENATSKNAMTAGDYGGMTLDEDDHDDNDNTSSGRHQRHRHNSKPSSSRLSNSNNNKADWHVINAFKMPRLVYITMRKQFIVQEERWSLFGSAAEKVNMLSHRYALTHQRLLRHSLFCPTQLVTARSKNALQHKLTPVESLLGKTPATAGTLLLLGILVQLEEGHYYLEDPSGQVLLSFQDAAPVDGFFVTEHCILLVEGTFQDEVFYVQRMGHPLLETRETSVQAIQQQVSHPSFSLESKTSSSSSSSSSLTVRMDDSSFCLVSDVHLDQPRVLQQLEGLFASYENYSSHRLPLFVLMGNFLSTEHQGAATSSSSSAARTTMTQAMDELASLIAKFPNLSANAHFCLVPGPKDGVGHVLPLPPLTVVPSVQNKVSHVHWASNPCRITWRSKEMVVFRYDLLHLLQREQVLLQDNTRTAAGSSDTMVDDNDDDNDNDAEHRRQPHCRLVKTILDQGHLMPVAGVPVYWNYAHALSLYPLPDALVLGGDGAAPFHEVYGGCNVIHPGSMHQQEGAAGTYAVYTPGADAATGLDDDSDSDNGGSSGGERHTVEFCQVGDEARFAE